MTCLAVELRYFEVLIYPGAGPIGWLLWALSVGTLALIVEGLLSIRRTNLLPDSLRRRVGELLADRQYDQAIDLTADRDDLLAAPLHDALTEAPHGYPAMEQAAQAACDHRAARLLRKVERLNLIGNISPMLGLFGTVWGMINAFFTIVEKGTPDPRDLAGGIGTALVTTLLGLAIAIPALAVYSLLRTRIDACADEALGASEDLLSGFRPEGAEGPAASQ